MSSLFLVLLLCDAASATAFTGAAYDAPFFVWDGGSRGDGLGQFDHPQGIADVGGAIAVADTGNMRVKIVSYEGYFQDFWGGEGSEPGRMRRPAGIAAADKGMVWVVDSGNHRVQKLTLARDRVSDYTGVHRLTINGFRNPSGAATDAKARLYVTDTGNRSVKVFTPSGKLVKTLTAGFAEPVGIAVDARDHLYVTDAASHRIVKLDAKGNVLTRWGTRGSAAGEFERPLGIAIDGEGFVYVADSGNHRVQKFSPEGTFVASVGCRGSGEGEMIEPTAVAIDAERHLYVVDSGNHRVQKLGHQ